MQQPADGGLHGLVGSIAIDELGRRWLVSTVDEPGLLSKESAYNIDIGPEPTTPSGQAPAQVADQVGDIDWHPLSWSQTTCPASPPAPPVEGFWWDTDSSTRTSSFAGVRDSVALLYGVDDLTADEDLREEMNLAPMCSGFFVDDKTVVTAAHCFYDLNELYFTRGARQVSVCNRGNVASTAQCAHVNMLIVPRGGIASQPGSSARNSWDIAVMKLTQPIGAGRRLRMSRASASVIAAEPSLSIGHPFQWDLPTCRTNLKSPRTNSSSPVGHNLFFSAEYVSHESEVIGTRNDILRTRHTGVQGWSGGPIYYHCPVSPHCSGSAFATGVMAGNAWRWPAARYTGGPLMRERRTWVQGFME